MMLIVHVLAGAVMTALGVWAARRSKPFATVLSAQMLFFVLLKVATGYFPTGEPCFFPWDWYPYVEPWWYILPALFLFGAGIVTVRACVWKRDLLLVGAGFLFLRTGVAAWVTDRPLELSGTVDERGVCLQTSGYSCAPAAAAAFLAQYGVDATEQEMAELCVTRTGGVGLMGTSDSGILRGLRRKLAGRGEVRIVRPSYERIPVPSLVPIKITPQIGHCILITRIHPEMIYLIDPLSGPATLPRRAFEQQWVGTAIYLNAKTQRGAKTQRREATAPLFSASLRRPLCVFAQ